MPLNEIFEKNRNLISNFLECSSSLGKKLEFPKNTKILSEDKAKAISEVVSFAHKYSGQLDSLFGGDSSTVLGFFSESLESEQPNFVNTKRYAFSMTLSELIEKAEKGGEEELLIGPEMWSSASAKNSLRKKFGNQNKPTTELDANGDPFQFSSEVNDSSFHRILSFWVDRRKKKKMGMSPLKRCGSSSPKSFSPRNSSKESSPNNAPLKRCISNNPSPVSPRFMVWNNPESMRSSSANEVDLSQMSTKEKQGTFSNNRSQSWVTRARHSIWK